MILNSPFSRHNKSHQTWHSHNGHNQKQHNGFSHRPVTPAQNGLVNGYDRHTAPFSTSSLRRPAAPQYPAPERPSWANAQATKPNGTTDNFRSSTLNRLDLLKARNKLQYQQQQQSHVLPKRNLSSLGHYRETNHVIANALPKPNYTNGFATRPIEQVYAPASIASPRELSNYQNQHYASSVVPVGNQSSASFDLNGGRTSTTTRSGRESALSGLIERFGTLKRRAKRHWPAIVSSSSRSSSRQSKQLTDKQSQSTYGTLSNTNFNNNQTLSSSSSTSSGKKLSLEAEEIYAEGQTAIDDNGRRRLLEQQLDPELMHDGETRTLIDRDSMRQLDFIQLVQLLTGWINDELADQRIIVRDLQEDLYDGQVLCKLVERLQNIKLDIIEVTQNELAQKYKIKTVLDTLNRIFSLQARWARIRWSIEGIHGKNMVEIIRLLVTMALYYRAPIKMPPNVQVNVLIFQKQRNNLIKRSHRDQLTDELTINLDLDNNRLSQQRDAFDLLIECAPEKLVMVKQSLVRFCNRHLNVINMSCSSPSTRGHLDDLDPSQFSDGLLLVFLISRLEDYFVPLGNLFTSIKHENLTSNHMNINDMSQSTIRTIQLPYIDSNNNTDTNLYAASKQRSADLIVQTDLDEQSLDQFLAEQPTALEPNSYINTQPIEKLHNVNVALQLIEEAGLHVRQRVRAEDVVNGDLKAVLRILYALFSRYKHL